MMRHQITMQLEKLTKNAVRYAEINADGQPVEQSDSVLGTAYIRKAKLGAGDPPQRITVTVDVTA